MERGNMARRGVPIMTPKRRLNRFPLKDALVSAQSGMVLGGSLGPNGGYVDVRIRDGSRSIEIIKSVMRQLGMPKAASVFRFCKPRGPKLA